MPDLVSPFILHIVNVAAIRGDEARPYPGWLVRDLAERTTRNVPGIKLIHARGIGQDAPAFWILPGKLRPHDGGCPVTLFPACIGFQILPVSLKFPLLFRTHACPSNKTI